MGFNECQRAKQVAWPGNCFTQLGYMFVGKLDL